MRVLIDEVVETDYGQLDLWFGDEEVDVEDEGDVEATFAGQVNGLAGAALPGRVYLNLARRSGGSALRVEEHDAEPPLDELGSEWDDVVEVSTTVGAQGSGGWTTWAGEDGGRFELAPGPHRVRVSARGRDAGAENEDADGTIDFYLVQLWPAPDAPDSVIRVGSENARYWHQEFGSKR